MPAHCIKEKCQKTASFNIKGEKTAIYCAKHKKDNMINIISKRCIYPGCEKIPSYNKEGEKIRLYCAKHKKDNMVNVVNKKCIYPGCTKQSSCNKKDEKIAIYCAEHKKDDMINVRNKKCIHPKCQKIPYFNKEDEKIAIYCAKHKKDNMINVISKKCIHPKCQKIPYFNKEGEKIPLYCISHKEDMVNVVNKKCINCNLTTANPKYKNHCVFCFIHLFPNEKISTNFKTKENTVMDALFEKFKDNKEVDISRFIRDKKITGGCSSRRPDLMYDCLSHWICVENDENQHHDYDNTCELQRLNDLYTDMGDRKMVLIRFNCDKYTNSDKTCNSLFKIQQKTGTLVIRNKKEFGIRITELYKTILKHIIEVPDDNIIEYLYYSD
jgi:hypothetical protein